MSNCISLLQRPPYKPGHTPALRTSPSDRRRPSLLAPHSSSLTPRFSLSLPTPLPSLLGFPSHSSLLFPHSSVFPLTPHSSSLSSRFFPLTPHSSSLTPRFSLSLPTPLPSLLFTLFSIFPSHSSLLFPHSSIFPSHSSLLFTLFSIFPSHSSLLFPHSSISGTG